MVKIKITGEGHQLIIHEALNYLISKVVSAMQISHKPHFMKVHGL